MRKSIVIAGVLAIGATAWIASGQFGGDNGPASAESSKSAAQKAEKPVIPVRVRELVSQSRLRVVTINGRTEESRSVIVRAETDGPITTVRGEEGRPLEDGEIIARQSAEDRHALLAEAVAVEKQRKVEHRAATALAKKGFRSDTKLAEAQAQLEAAQARSKSMRIDLSRTTIRAPFAGILENRHIEKGDFLQKGDEIASIMDLDPILAVGYISERDIGSINVGAKGTVRLMDGRTVSGNVRFVGSVADSATRSFRVELEIPNPDYSIRAGLTGELQMPLKTVSAHVISPAWLALADDGRIGVRTVNAKNIVEFLPIGVIADTAEGLWVSGIPDRSRVITVGHEFVKAGETVKPVPETAETSS